MDITFRRSIKSIIQNRVIVSLDLHIVPVGLTDIIEGVYNDAYENMSKSYITERGDYLKMSARMNAMIVADTIAAHYKVNSGIIDSRKLRTEMKSLCPMWPFC